MGYGIAAKQAAWTAAVHVAPPHASCRLCVPLLVYLQAAKAAIELGYQPDEQFLLKISQLRELFVVRWSVFLLGSAGCGKTAVWRTLMRAQNAMGEKTIYQVGYQGNRVHRALQPCSARCLMTAGERR